MNKDLLLTDIAKLLELDKHLLKDTFLLNEDANWDSLAVVSIVAAIDHHYDVSVKGIELMSCNSIKDIFSLIESNLMTLI